MSSRAQPTRWEYSERLGPVTAVPTCFNTTAVFNQTAPGKHRNAESFSVPVWWTLPFSLSFCLPLLLSARAALVSSALCWGIPANCLHIPRLPLLKPGHCSLSYSLYCHEIDDDGNSGTDGETDVCWNGMRSVYGISVYSLKHRSANTVQQLHKGGKRGDCKWTRTI